MPSTSTSACGEVADLRVHRHHRAAANDVAPARPAAVRRRVAVVRRGGARREQIETRRRRPRSPPQPSENCAGNEFAAIPHRTVCTCSFSPCESFSTMTLNSTLTLIWVGVYFNLQLSPGAAQSVRAVPNRATRGVSRGANASTRACTRRDYRRKSRRPSRLVLARVRTPRYPQSLQHRIVAS